MISYQHSIAVREISKFFKKQKWSAQSKLTWKEKVKYL